MRSIYFTLLTFFALQTLFGCTGETVNTASGPSVTLTATPSTIASGASSTLNWSSTQASACVASGGWSGSKTISGSQVVTGLTQTNSYILTCTGSGGNASQTATVTITPASNTPTVSLSASPSTVSYNAASTLAWSSSNATACVAAGAWSGNKPTSGSQALSNLTATGTYTLTCNNTNGSAVQSVIVTVMPPPPVTGTNLTTVALTNQGAAGEVVATFGQAFKQGDVAANASVGAMRASGAVVPLQVDKKASFADGSLRHAILTTRLTLAANETVSLTLFSKTPDSAATPIGFMQLMDNTAFDAAVALTIDGKTHSSTVRNLYASGATVQTWLSGPEVSEWIIKGPIVTDAADIAATPAIGHLMAYFHVRAYAGLNRVRVDSVVENNWTFKDDPGRVDYNANVTVGNSTIYSGSVAHYHHSRWHQLGWWGAASEVFARPDRQYLRDTLAVPNYAALTVNDSVLNAYTQTIAPMSNADLRTYWPGTGYDKQIGLMPEWYAAFVMSGDARAYKGVLVNDSAGGSFSYHYRDENTGTMPSIVAHSTLSEQGMTGGLKSGAGGSPYTHDDAHAALVGYLGYLLTGDYYYLEELQFLANWHILHMNAGYRQGAQALFNNYLQNRARAWGLRTVAHAAAITPDSHPLKAYFTDVVNNNITYHDSTWSSPPANDLGAIQDYDWQNTYGNPQQYSPWQNDFLTAVFGRLVELGFSNATAQRNWMAQWPTGRMGQGNNGYCWVYATNYNFTSGIVQSSGQYNTSFQQLYQENFPSAAQQACPGSGPMNDAAYPALATGYYSNMQPALAIAVDAGVATQATWNKFVSAGTPNYASAPVWAVVPRLATSMPPAPGVPTIAFSANPTSVVSGGSATLTWSSTNASECNASGAWGGTKLPNDSQSTGALTANSTFTLTCTGSGGSAGVSVNVSIGTPPPGGNPINNLQPGQWHVFPSSNLSAVDPCPANNCSYTGNEGQAAVMNDWAGGAFDTTRNRLMVWGGGHGGYGGNEVYAFSLTTGTWSRLTEPSNPITTCTNFYPDGSPAATHSYNFLQYIPALDSFTTFSAGQFCPQGGAGALGAVNLNLTSNTWSKRAAHPAGSHIGAITAYDPSTGYVWMKATGSSPSYDAATSLYRYDPSADTWTAGDSGNSDLAYAYGLTAAIDHTRNKMVAVGEGLVIAWDISNPSNVTRQNINSTGANSIINANDPGFVYDPVSDRFVAWNGGSDLFMLNPDTWEWTKITLAPGNTIIPTSANQNGTYGRFRYVPSLHALVVVNRTNENVYIFKIP